MTQRLRLWVESAKHIKHYLRGEGGEVLMSNGRNLPVSRRLKPALMDALERI